MYLKDFHDYFVYQRGRSPNSWGSYETDLRQFFRFLEAEGVSSPERVTADHTPAFLRALGLALAGDTLLEC